MVKPYLKGWNWSWWCRPSIRVFYESIQLIEACPKQDFLDTTGLGFTAIQETIDWAIEMGYIDESDSHWQITKKGKLFLNDLLEAFMVD